MFYNNVILGQWKELESSYFYNTKPLPHCHSYDLCEFSRTWKSTTHDMGFLRRHASIARVPCPDEVSGLIWLVASEPPRLRFKDQSLSHQLRLYRERYNNKGPYHPLRCVRRAHLPGLRDILATSSTSSASPGAFTCVAFNLRLSTKKRQKHKKSKQSSVVFTVKQKHTL